MVSADRSYNGVLDGISARGCGVGEGSFYELQGFYGAFRRWG